MSGAYDWLAVGDVGEARSADHHLTVGGSAGRLVLHAAALGASVAMVGKLGDDEAGRRTRDALTRAGVDLSWLPNGSGMRTTTWLDPDGSPASRRIDRGADLNLRLDELPPRSVQASLTVVSGSTLAAEPARSAAIGALASAASRGGNAALLLEAEVLWSTNARMTRRILEPALAASSSVALTEEDARALLGPVTARQAVRLVAQMGPRIVYLVDADGAVVLRDGSHIEICPAPGGRRRDRFAGPAAFWVALSRKAPAAKAAADSVRYAATPATRATRKRSL